MIISKQKQSGQKPKPKISLLHICSILFPYLLAAVISAVIGIITFKEREIAPFGEKSVLCMDLWGQYFPMYVNNKEAEGLSGLLYSWNGAFGFNNWVQSAYYCNSIFIFLLRFIPNHLLVTAVDIFCLVKMSLSSVTCLGLMQYKFRMRSPILIAGAVSYSVCAYMLAFLSQFMWTDALFLAPLMLIGLERLIHQKKTLLYTLVLAVSIISSFYIGFAMCIFSVLYFAANSILQIDLTAADKQLRKASVKQFGFTCLRFSVFSVLAGAISAAVIIPVGLGISNTIASELGAPEQLEWYGNITSVLRDFLPEQRIFLEYEGANLAVGSIVFLALPLYFFNGSIRPAERIANGVVGAFLLASVNCNLLNYMWHGFHFPNQLPGRWTFLFSLFVILLCCQGLLHWDKLTPARALGSCSLGFAVFYVTSKGLGDTPEYELPDGTWEKLAVLAVIIYAASILAYLRNMPPKVKAIPETEAETAPEASSESAPEAPSEFDNTPEPVPAPRKHILNPSVLLSGCALLMAAVMIADAGNNFVTVSQYEGSSGLQVSPEASYTDQLERASRNGLERRAGEDTFYRIEANNGFTFNPSMIGNYHGMRYYSSTMNGNVFRFLKYMGNRVYADKVSSVYTLASPVQNSLFGVKYFMDFDRYLERVVPGTVIIDENEDGLFRENTTALPLAYAVSDDLLGFAVTDQIRAIQTHNELVNRMCGETLDPYQFLDWTTFTTENVTLGESQDWNVNYFHLESGQTRAVFHYSYTVPEGLGGFLFFEHNFRAGSMQLTAPNLSKIVNSGDGAFTYVGRLNAGDTLNVDVTVENVGLGCYGMNLYRMDEQIWDRAYHKLDSQGLQVTHFDNTRVDGTMTLENASLVFASIPNDGGWKAYCDGEALEVLPVCGDALIAVRVPAGTHEISFRYHVPGLAVGMVISILGLLLTFGLAYYQSIIKLFRKKA